MLYLKFRILVKIRGKYKGTKHPINKEFEDSAIYIFYQPQISIYTTLQFSSFLPFLFFSSFPPLFCLCTRLRRVSLLRYHISPTRNSALSWAGSWEGTVRCGIITFDYKEILLLVNTRRVVCSDPTRPSCVPTRPRV